jgi:hypothetical protein
MRDPDRGDVDLILRLYDLRREAEMRKARAFVMGFQPQRIEDVLAVMDWAHPENAHFRQATSYWEMVSDFAGRELLHPEMFATHCGEAFFFHAKFEPWIDELRRRGFPRFQRNLSAAAAKHPAIAERRASAREILAARERAALR